MTKLFTMKVDVDEYQLFKSTAENANMPLATYIKKLMHGQILPSPKKLKTIEPLPISNNVYFELVGMHKILTQIAKNNKDNLDVLCELQALSQKFDELLDAH